MSLMQDDTVNLYLHRSTHDSPNDDECTCNDCSTVLKRKCNETTHRLLLRKQRIIDTAEWTNKIPISKFPRYEYASAQLCSINERHNKIAKSSNIKIELFSNAVHLTTCPLGAAFDDIDRIFERDNINAEIPKVITIVLNKVPPYDDWYWDKRHNLIILVENDTICKDTKLAIHKHGEDEIKVVTHENYYREIDLLLERIVFRNLKTLLMELERLSNEPVCSTSSYASSLPNASVINRLIGDILGLFYRSNVPRYERPNNIGNATGRHVNEKVVQTLSTRVKTFRGCGYRNGTFHIYVEESDQEDTEIGAILNEFNITDYTKSVISSSTLFSRVGAVVKTGADEERFGTLGGFALMGQDKKLCALVSKHVVKGATELFVVGENNSPIRIGKILTASEELSGGQIDIDVAAAVIQEGQANYDTWFKDSRGRQKCARLFEFTMDKIDWLRNLPVHMYGATTSLGRGTITMPEMGDPEMQHILIVEDNDDMIEPSETIERFCAPGDSGAIICADDPNGTDVHVIAMLIGKREIEETSRKRNEYMSVRLKTGLQKLSEETGKTFTICESGEYL